MVRDLIIKNRSYRRFDASVKISNEQAEKWVELARFSASGRNMQPLKYLICTDRKVNEQIFPNLGWAGYLNDWPGPGEKERPVAYIMCLSGLYQKLSTNRFKENVLLITCIIVKNYLCGSELKKN
ncbi:MAG: nitroreductase family protein [Prolixibacteraceae bacterium]|nr:nitroreductase family protein [Prolixibacteraceae bacterium]